MQNKRFDLIKGDRRSLGVVDSLSVLQAFKLILISLFITTILISGCSCPSGRPPDRNVINPVVIPDGVGGHIVAYQKNMGKGPITYLQRLGPEGNNLWQDTQIDSSQPFKPYTNSPTELVGDEEGNVFIIWGVGDDAWIQKYDINGSPVWENKVKAGSCNRLYKLAAISDSQRGVIVGCYGSRGEFWLQRFNGDGEAVWSSHYRMSDNAGFDIALDSENNLLLIYVTLERSIYLQKLDLSANSLWSSSILLDTHRPVKEDGTLITHQASFSEYTTWLISDQSGGCLVVYTDSYGDTLIDRSLNIYKVNAGGDILWTKRLTAELGEENSQITDYGMNQVVSDGFGGVFVLYKVRSERNDLSIVVQHIDSSGNEIINADGDLIDETWSVYLYDGYQVISDGSGGVVVVWTSVTRDENGTRTGAIMRGQRLDREGQKLWEENGVVLSNINIASMDGSPSLTSNGADGFIISLRGYVWKIGPDGKLVWEKRV